MNSLRWAARVGAERRELVSAVGCLIAATIIWTCVETPVAQMWWLDPYFYLGLVNNYQDIVARYGSTYYSARLSYLAPSIFLNQIFGLDAGYTVFRVLVFAATGAVIFRYARVLFSLSAALVVTAWFFFHPAILRGLTWDFMDGYAACCLLVAVLLSVMPTRRPLLTSAAAGFAFGCAVDAYPLTLLVGGAFAPSWLWLGWREGWQGLWRRAAAIIAGFVLSFVCVMVAQMVLSPGADPFGPVLVMAKSVFSGGTAQWHADVLAAIRENAWYVLLFPLVAFAGLFGLRGRISKPPYLAASTAYLLLSIAMYLVLDSVFRMGVFNNTISTIYLAVPMITVLIPLVGEMCAKGARIGAILAVATALCGVFFFAHDALLPYVTYFNLKYLAVASALSLALILLAGPQGRGIGLAIVLVVGPIIYSASYPQIFDHMRKQSLSVQEHDVRHGSAHLQNVVSRLLRPDDGAVGFWYRKEPALTLLDSLQSSHLWAYSRVVNYFNDDPGMPAITPSIKTSLLNKPFIVLLGESEVEVTAGLDALRVADISYQILDREQFKGRQWSYWLAVVKMQAGSESDLRLKASIQLNEFKPDHGQVQVVRGGVRVQTANLPYSYGARLDLTPHTQGGPRAGVIRVKIIMERGEAGFAVTKADDYSNILAEKVARPGLETIDLTVSDLSQAGTLVVRSTDDALGDWVTIQSVTVLESGQAKAP